MVSAGTCVWNWARKQSGPGRPKLRPRCIVGDKGYSSRKLRQYVYRYGMRTPSPQAPREPLCPFDRAIYRLCNRVERLFNRVERLFNRLKQFRRLATRYDKRAENYRAMWIIAATILWLWFAYTP